MRFALLLVIALGAVIGFTGVLGSSASAAQLTTDSAQHQPLLASTTPSPTPLATATATVKASSTPTAAGVPKAGGPPDTTGTSPLAYLLIALGSLTVAGAAFAVVK